MKDKYSKLYWFVKDLEWMRVYFSPFKFFLPKLYVGKTKIGVPYFLPRKFIKATPELAHKAALEFIKETESFNERNPDYKRRVRDYQDVYQEKLKCSYPIPLKIGFSSCSLGWKTKYDSYRHEWNPVWSFVCFGYQIALIFRPEHDMHYWECWLAYNLETDKSKSAKERIEEAKEKFPCRWSYYSGDEKITTNYWDLILKSSYN